MRQSTWPRHGSGSKVLRLDQIGASSSHLLSIPLTRTPASETSFSTYTTVRACGRASLRPASSPPPPAHTLSTLTGRVATLGPVFTEDAEPLVIRVLDAFMPRQLKLGIV